MTGYLSFNPVSVGVGSFDVLGLPCMVVALDEDIDSFQLAGELPPGPYYRVFGASHRILFSGSSFDLVICNHALEHIQDVEESLSEIRRILKPPGRLAISVPNGHGLCDSIYHFLFVGGGHVNRFRWNEVVDLVERDVGLRLVSWHKLYSSFAYLSRLAEALDDNPISLPKRARSVCKIPRLIIYAMQRGLYRITRLADRLLPTNLAVYGWTFYFAHSSQAAAEQPAYLNVCLRCGSGQPLQGMDRRSRWVWHCNACDTMNPFVKPFRNTI